MREDLFVQLQLCCLFIVVSYALRQQKRTTFTGEPIFSRETKLPGAKRREKRCNFDAALPASEFAGNSLAFHLSLYQAPARLHGVLELSKHACENEKASKGTQRAEHNIRKVVKIAMRRHRAALGARSRCRRRRRINIFIPVAYLI